MKVILANPRGFCAGVDRAIEIVERAIELFGSPMYVRHEIVHNKHVCDSLRAKGAIFVDELSEVPDEEYVIFSAHGVSKAIIEDAKNRGLQTINATCPLVTKVHMEAKALAKRGHRLLLIGHQGHPEVEGTLGQVSEPMLLIETVEDVEKLDWPAESEVAYLTQTTLSVDETAEIIAALQQKFKNLKCPPKEDICYATTNRQSGVREFEGQVDMLLVLGAENSSNSKRLQELGVKKGFKSFLIGSAAEIDQTWFEGVGVVGITSGASAPEALVQEVVRYIKENYETEVVSGLQRMVEDVKFPMPKIFKDKKEKV
jgi:4-hydroxy-3-methylbut-2-enyl diphosphate reductase